MTGKSALPIAQRMIDAGPSLAACLCDRSGIVTGPEAEPVCLLAWEIFLTSSLFASSEGDALRRLIKGPLEKEESVGRFVARLSPFPQGVLDAMPHYWIHVDVWGRDNKERVPARLKTYSAGLPGRLSDSKYDNVNKVVNDMMPPFQKERAAQQLGTLNVLADQAGVTSMEFERSLKGFVNESRRLV